MKKFSANFAVLAVLVFPSFAVLSGTAKAEALSESCMGSAYLPGQSVNGYCNNGSCTGWVSGSSVTSNGTCSGGVSYQASGYTNGSMISGTCNGNILIAYLSSQYINLNGTCSSGASFTGSGYGNTSSLSGSCNPNGSFYGSIFPSNVNVNGTCQ